MSTNDTHANGRDPVAKEQAAAGCFTSRERGQIYHFLELALAHPGEGGHEYFCEAGTEQQFLQVFEVEVQGDPTLAEKGVPAARRFFAGLRGMSYEQVEGSYIALFTNNFPHLPCPPYGSLFTAIDSEKRLEEMLAIKEFYQSHGVDIADSFDDLPDHLCVELEFMQLLCFREREAADAKDQELLDGVRKAETEFLDKYLLPFATRLADLAVGSAADNPYSDLLDAARCFLLTHRKQLGEPAALPSENIRS